MFCHIVKLLKVPENINNLQVVYRSAFVKIEDNANLSWMNESFVNILYPFQTIITRFQ